MMQKRTIKAILIAVVLIAMLITYSRYIRPAYQAARLLQSGKPVRAIVTGNCVPFPMEMPKSYFFRLNDKSYFGHYTLPEFYVTIGDTIDVLYLPDNADISMSKLDAKVHASSMWSVCFFDK